VTGSPRPITLYNYRSEQGILRGASVLPTHKFASPLCCYYSLWEIEKYGSNVVRSCETSRMSVYWFKRWYGGIKRTHKQHSRFLSLLLSLKGKCRIRDTDTHSFPEWDILYKNIQILINICVTWFRKSGFWVSTASSQDCGYDTDYDLHDCSEAENQIQQKCNSKQRPPP
jgi:hypothetical protein